MKKAIRNEYADLGVETYYRTQGDSYANPHALYLAELLEKNRHRIDYTQTLDLACGGGEVTQILRGLGFENALGCDPFTRQLFERNTSKECLEFNFEDIVKGRLTAHFGAENRQFTTIVCSFALHLCIEKQLFTLVAELFRLTENIVIITPHKRPELERLPNVQLYFEDFALTKRGKKVTLKSYRKH